MKKIPIFYPLMIGTLLLLQNCSTSKTVMNENAHRFPVCEVDRSTTLLPTSSYSEVIQEMIKERNAEERNALIQQDSSLDWSQKSELMGDPSYLPEGAAQRKLESSAQSDQMLIKADFHPFMAAMHHAYAHHYPLTIDPDMIWLIIAQGFATHINQHPEEMRQHFVDFKGKKRLNIDRPGWAKGDPNNDWPGAFAEFSEQIEANTGPALLDLITGDFSTTNAIEKAAFQVTLMDAMKSYFQYSMTTVCGIPEITVEGTVEDWKAIEAKAAELAQYDLDWWMNELQPILQEFTKAAQGKPDTKFWQNIYKWNEVGSGNPYITGWILKFFPYLEQYGEIVQVIQKNKSIQNGQEITYDLQAGTDDFTSGLSQADMLWNYHGQFYKMELIAGFVGYQQDPKSYALRPVISWYVVDKQAKATAQEIEDYWKGGHKTYREDQKKN